MSKECNWLKHECTCNLTKIIYSRPEIVILKGETESLTCKQLRKSEGFGLNTVRVISA